MSFRAALVDARDYMGMALAETWKRLKADDFSYMDVGADDDRGRRHDKRRSFQAGVGSRA